MAKKSTICETDGCGQDVLCVGLCVNCYSRLHYAMKMGPKWAMERQHKFRVYGATLEVVRPRNVTVLHRERRRA